MIKTTPSSNNNSNTNMVQSNYYQQFISVNTLTEQRQINIFPCCYQLFTTNPLNKNPQSTLLNHSCLLATDDQYNQSHPSPFKINSSSLFSKDLIKSKLEILEKSHFQCSVCQKSQIQSKDLPYFNCLNCKRQFCSKCNSEVHSKGKFMSHQILQIKQKPSNNLTSQNFINCQIHSKPRKYLLRNKIVCQICFKEQTGKIPNQDLENSDPSFLQENIKFSLQYFNEIYHNQANKMAELKQNLNKIYSDCVQRFECKYKSSLSQIEKIEACIKTNFTEAILELTKMTSEVQIIFTFSQPFSSILSKNILNTRMNLIQEKIIEIQSQCEEFMTEISYDYRIGDKEKNQLFLEQFLKCINLFKIKRQEQDNMDTNRNTLRTNMKTSRTTSRLSAQKIPGTKDNRCQSAFNKHQNMSSSKLNSSVKDKQRNSLAKNNINQTFNSKNLEVKKSVVQQNQNRSSIGKSMTKISSVQPSYTNCRNNSALFNQKDKNIDVKDLEKAEYQDFNINLKKIMGAKKTNDSQTLANQNENLKQESSATSLGKESKEIDLRGIKLIRENEKSSVNSGSFLKIFDQKNRSGGRKNYLVSSQELPQPDSKPKQVRFESKSKGSPQKISQIPKKKIREEIYGSQRGSSSNKFSEVDAYDKYKTTTPSVINSNPSKKDINSKNSNKSGQQSKRQTLQNKSCILDNLVALSEERKDSKIVSDFNFKSEQDKVINDMTKSLVSQFSCIMTGQITQSQVYENIKDVQIIESINLQEQSKKTSKSPSKMNKSIAKPFQLSKSVFKDSTNTLKGTQKTALEKTANIMNEKLKKKPDFMDMREKMRKPNYLSTKLNNNLNGPIETSKKFEYGKK